MLNAFRIIVSAVMVFFLSACSGGCSGPAQNGSTTNPPPKEQVRDYVPFIASALDTAKLGFDTWTSKAVQKKDFSECIASTTLSSATLTAKAVLQAEFDDAEDTHTIPSPAIDFSACTPFKDGLTEEKPEETQAKLTQAQSGINLALTAVQLYLPKIEDCKTRVAVIATTKYLQGALDPVLDEIKKPDGKVDIPPVEFSLAECKEGGPSDAEPTPD